ncbi:MAG: ABC transporter ATP-binding protein [Candidatus Rokubacteria bacterium]|nr:ABC transporter ATP-binding protein [Candidatus Rokubacteria bacterium]
MLSLDGVEAGYGPIKALKGVTLKVSEGRIVALLGANGAGKTTALRTVSGLIRPTAGSVTIDGTRLDRLSPEEIVRRGIVQVPEGRRLFAGLTVLENLRMGAYCRTGDLTADLERVYRYFPVLGERTRQPGGSLSGGEQQMLAIGRALMARPRVLLLDEPSLGLAPKLVTEIFTIIRTINVDGVTVLLVEQNAYQALSIAHYSYVLRVGRVVLEGTAEELRGRNDVVRSYLGRQTTDERATSRT